MAKDFRTLMRERRQAKAQGVPQVDPDDVVTERIAAGSPSAALSQEEEALKSPELSRRTVSDAAELVKVGTVMHKDRHKQVKQEALDTESKEWEVIERALEMYFRAKRS